MPRAQWKLHRQQTHAYDPARYALQAAVVASLFGDGAASAADAASSSGDRGDSGDIGGGGGDGDNGDGDSGDGDSGDGCGGDRPGRRGDERLLASLRATADHSARFPRPPPALQHALVCAGAAVGASARKEGTAAWLRGEARARLLASYAAFVRREVLPRFDDGSGKIVYQAEPGVRVALPSARAAGGRPRCDAEHYHQPGEVSVWVPLCGCVAANALHVAAGPGDDAPLLPLPLQHGEWAAWSGHRCRSGFVANTSADASVSLDFRVIPWSSYREDRSAAKKSNHNLRLGSYYAVMDAAEHDAAS